MNKKIKKRPEKKKRFKEFKKIRDYVCLLNKPCGYKTIEGRCYPKERFDIFECVYRIGNDEDVKEIIQRIEKENQPKRRRRRRR